MVKIYGIFSLDSPSRIRYVGKTSKEVSFRFNQHLNAAKKSNPRLPLYKWMSKNLGSLDFVVLAEVRDADADEAEIKAIRELGTHVSDGGLNVLIGGDGRRAGTVASEESKAKLRGWYQKNTHPNLGKKWPEEMRKRISDGMKRYNANNPRREPPAGKLSWNSALDIRILSKIGASAAELANSYGVHPASIKRVIQNVTWKEEEYPTWL